MSEQVAMGKANEVAVAGYVETFVLTTTIADVTVEVSSLNS